MEKSKAKALEKRLRIVEARKTKKANTGVVFCDDESWPEDDEAYIKGPAIPAGHLLMPTELSEDEWCKRASEYYEHAEELQKEWL